MKENRKNINVLENIKNNILYLCRIQGKNLGDAERFAGKNAGYLSRNRRFDVCTLIGFAEYFSVTPNDLIYKDYREVEIDKQIEYLQSEIDVLESKKAERRKEMSVCFR